jgi:hypothetical protein
MSSGALGSDACSFGAMRAADRPAAAASSTSAAPALAAPGSSRGSSIPAQSDTPYSLLRTSEDMLGIG